MLKSLARVLRKHMCIFVITVLFSIAKYSISDGQTERVNYMTKRFKRQP